MTIKNLSRVKRRIKNIVPDVKKRFSKDLKREIVDILVEKITSGSSPVAGHGTYKKYSKKYAQKKGRTRPVDLTVTGKMLNSMTAKQDKNNNLVIEIKSKIAKFHDVKSIARVFRPMLPKGNQSFTRDIMDKIIRILKKAVKKSI